MTEHYEKIIEFWLGDVAAPASELNSRARRWFGADTELDREIEARFSNLLARWPEGEIAGWAASPRGRLALIILLDQFSRNIHRGTEKAFAFDHEALELSRSGIDAGMDQHLEPLERLFFYMPFEHAEDGETQQRSVALFEALAAASSAHQRSFFDHALIYVREHRDLIVRFGRFPHRNRVLGRESTPEESAYLTGGGKTFGQ
ncbi:MAG: DUF924 family protein [Gammaproteobacteria bacterium]|nr:DUF924 family protein [Gammaproteobacteria bacterium]